MKEPAERLQLVFRLALHWVGFTLRRGWAGHSSVALEGRAVWEKREVPSNLRYQCPKPPVTVRDSCAKHKRQKDPSDPSMSPSYYCMHTTSPATAIAESDDKRR